MVNQTNIREDRDVYKKMGIDIKSKPYKRYLKAGLLYEKDEDFIDEVQNYWKSNYRKTVDPVLNLAFFNLTGKKDPRVVPGHVMWSDLIPFFNDMDVRIGYSDKNIYDKLIKSPRSAETVIKRVRGTYFDANNNGFDSFRAFQEMVSIGEDVIIKPSNTDNGKGIAKLTFEDEKCYLDGSVVTMSDLEKTYGANFIVQKKILQHPVMATPHPASVNTLRMVTFHWKNEIKYLLTFARFGANNAVRDNAGTGGVCLGVTDSGEFMDLAVDEHTNVHTHHPSTNYCFADHAQIPNFEDFKRFVIDMHKDIIHHDFISWDIAVGRDGQPIFLELNFRGATWLYQLATQRPMFGDLTEEVLQYVSEELETNTLKRNMKSKVSTVKISNKKLKADNTKIGQQNKELLEENKKLQVLTRKYKKQNRQITNSRSWKLTSPVRKIGGATKRLLGKKR